MWFRRPDPREYPILAGSLLALAAATAFIGQAVVAQHWLQSAEQADAAPWPVRAWFRSDWPSRAPEPWKPERNIWKRQPTLWVCSETHVTVSDVQQAAEEWARHGAPLLEVLPSSCEDRPLPYQVHIMNSSDFSDGPWDEGKIGLTVTYSFRDGPGMAGEIYLTDSDPTVLLHEIGHIWFRTHHLEPGHVLHASEHPFYPTPSWEGVERQFAVMFCERPGAPPPSERSSLVGSLPSPHQRNCDALHRDRLSDDTGI